MRVLDGNAVVAQHRRSFGAREQIEDPAHLAGLTKAKLALRGLRGQELLTRSCPASRDFLGRMSGYGLPVGSAVQMLLRLLDVYSAPEVEAALQEVARRDAVHPHAVRHVLETNRAAAGRAPALPLVLPDDPRVRTQTVRLHDLHTYDELKEPLDEAAPAQTDPEHPPAG